MNKKVIMNKEDLRNEDWFFIREKLMVNDITRHLG
jgi:hypothetical protein